MTRPLLAFTLLALAAVLPACSLSSESGDPLDGNVRFAAADGEISIVNGSAERIYYAAFARDILPGINWAQHLDDGPSLASGESAILPYVDVWQATMDDEVVVFWWRTEVRGGEREPTEPEAVIVGL